MNRAVLVLALAGVLALTPAPGALAQSPPIIFQPSPDSPIGVRNQNAPPQTAELDFLIGDWDVDIVLHRPNGDLTYRARWHNTWVVDGHAIMQEWRGPFATGAELRTFNPQTGRWEGHNFYAGRQTWTGSNGAFVDGEFVIETSGIGPNGPFINRERYFDIQPDSFRMEAVRSVDGGQTWSASTYEMVCTRLERRSQR